MKQILKEIILENQSFHPGKIIERENVSVPPVTLLNAKLLPRYPTKR